MRCSVKSITRYLRSDSAQVLPLFALLVFVIIGLLGLATDIGRLYVARAELGRAVDSAALAGANELPNVTAADTAARDFLNANDPDNSMVITVNPDSANNQVTVAATKNVSTIFMRVLGINSVSVKNDAVAGFGTLPLDAYLTLDATGSMHTGCNAGETNTGGACPIKEARDAATSFVNTLLGTTPNGYTVIGAGAHRGCFDPPRANVKCIDASGSGSMITNLTTNKTSLLNGIGAIRAIGATGQPSGGSGTNICGAFKKGQDVIFGAGSHTASNTLRYLVILSDGDNVYNAGEVNQTSPQSPEAPCRPTSPSTSQSDLSTNCRSDTQPQEAKVDALTQSMANTLKAQGVEIYVVALSVCGGISTAPLCNTASIGLSGTSYPDSLADHNLMKCVASSKSGTNDHYFETTSAAALPAIFTQIAQQIAFRLIK